MGLDYPGGTIIYRTFDVSTISNIISGVKTGLVDAGWSSTGIKAYVVLTFTGQPSNNQTCAFDGTTFTAKTSPVDPTDFQIGTTKELTASNLATVINSQSATCEAAAVDAVVTVSYETAGESGNGKTASEALSNATLDSTTFRWGGYWLQSAETPEGLGVKLDIHDDGNGTYARCKFSSHDNVAAMTEAQVWSLQAVASRMLTILACKYQFFIWLDGTSSIAYCELMAGVPKIPAAHKAKVVSSVADNGGLFEVTTATAHGRSNGDTVTIAGATGCTGLNGTWTITVIDTTRYTLTGSTYNSGYVANSAVAAGGGEIARCVWAMGNIYTWRKTLGYYLSGSGWYQTSWICVNNVAYVNTLSSQYMGWTFEWFGTSLYVPLDLDDAADIVKPVMSACLPTAAGTRRRIGLLWGAFVLSRYARRDAVKTNFDGYDWVCVNSDEAAGWSGSLWLAKAVAA